MTRNKIIYILAAMLVLLPSCTKERGADMQEGDPVEIRISLTGADGTRAANAGSDADRTISRFRMLAYTHSTGRLAYDTPVTLTRDVDDDRWVGTLGIRTGKYDFVFLANVDPGCVLDDSADPIGGLRNFSLDNRTFGRTSDIPMISRIYEGVSVQGDNKVLLNGASQIQASPWNIDVERMAVRIDLHFKLTPGQKEMLKQISLSNIPTVVYALPGRSYDGAYESWRWNVGYTITGPDPSGDYSFDFERVIVPESVFTPVDAKGKGMALSMEFTDGTIRSGVIGIAPGVDYTLPRNTYLDISGTVSDKIDFKISVEPWGYPVYVPVE